MIFVFGMFHLVYPFNYSMIAHRRAVVCIRTSALIFLVIDFFALPGYRRFI